MQLTKCNVLISTSDIAGAFTNQCLHNSSKTDRINVNCGIFQDKIPLAISKRFPDEQSFLGFQSYFNEVKE